MSSKIYKVVNLETVAAMNREELEEQFLFVQAEYLAFSRAYYHEHICNSFQERDRAALAAHWYTPQEKQ